MKAKASKKRSLKQNRYRWGVVVATILNYINEELRQSGSDVILTPDDIDLYIKENVLKISHRIQTSIGEITVKGKIRNRTPAGFEEAMEQIRAYFAKRGIDIDLPNEPDWDNDYKDNLARF